MAEETMKSLLDLDTAEAVRPFITIEGVKYEINTSDDLGIKHLAKIGSIGKRVDRIMNKEDVGEAEGNEIAAGLSSMVKMIVREIPDELEAKLKDGQRLAIVQAFNTAGGLKTATAPPKVEQPKMEAEPAQELSQAV